MMHWYGNDINAWGWLGMTLGMVAFWGLLVTAIVLLVRPSGHSSQPSGQPQTPEQILAGRFARGEIDDTEFHAKLSALHMEVLS